MSSASADIASLAAALISPLGRGAVAAWRILGTPDSILRLPFVTPHRSRIEEQPIGRIWFGDWNGEEAVLTRTASHEWELSVHGGYSAVQRVRKHLEGLGCEIHNWRELLLEGASMLQAEYDIAATKTVTWTTTELLLRHPTRRWIEELQQWQIVFDRQPTKAEREQFVSRCHEWLSWSRFGRHLTRPYTVALVGEPNVGKSSLLNRLAGFDRAIVQDRPGTTRDLVAVDTSFCGFPFSLTDTAGLRDTSDQLESEGISRTHKVLREADLILHLIDISISPSAQERTFANRYPSALLVAHKCDRSLHPQRTLAESALRVSSLTGEGLDDLAAAIVARLIPKFPERQTVFPVTDRQVDLLQLLRAHGGADQPQTLSAGIAELLGSVHQHLTSNS